MLQNPPPPPAGAPGLLLTQARGKQKLGGHGWGAADEKHLGFLASLAWQPPQHVPQPLACSRGQHPRSMTSPRCSWIYRDTKLSVHSCQREATGPLGRG